MELLISVAGIIAMNVMSYSSFARQWRSQQSMGGYARAIAVTVAWQL